MSDLELAILPVHALLALAYAQHVSRRLRRLQHSEWAETLRSADRRHVRQIAKTVGRGEAVRDPRDADLALAAVRQARTFFETFASPVALLLLVAGCAFAVGAYLAVGGWLSAALAIADGVAIVGWLATWAARRWYEPRWERAYAANAQLAADYGASRSAR